MGMNLQGVAGVAVSRSQIVNNPDGIFISGPIAGTFQLQCNNITGNAGFGLRSNINAAVAAPDNWFGSASGPTHPSNPTGTGDSVVDGTNGGAGTVNFMPFLDSNWEVNPHCRFQPAPALGHVGLALCALGLLLFGYLLSLRQRVR